MNVLYRQAYELLASPKCRQAFDLSAEPEDLRIDTAEIARPSVPPGSPARRRRGCRWSRSSSTNPREVKNKAPGVTDAYGWDTHNDIFEALKMHLLPRFDRSFATLLVDLEERGLLDETLVVCMGEFGRAPRVALEASFAGQSPGRKHWANVYSVVLAGGRRVARGRLRPVRPDRGPCRLRPGRPLGPGRDHPRLTRVDPTAEYADPLNRPLREPWANPSPASTRAKSA